MIAQLFSLQVTSILVLQGFYDHMSKIPFQTKIKNTLTILLVFQKYIFFMKLQCNSIKLRIKLQRQKSYLSILMLFLLIWDINIGINGFEWPFQLNDSYKVVSEVRFLLNRTGLNQFIIVLQFQKIILKSFSIFFQNQNYFKRSLQFSDCFKTISKQF